MQAIMIADVAEMNKTQATTINHNVGKIIPAMKWELI